MIKVNSFDDLDKSMHLLLIIITFISIFLYSIRSKIVRGASQHIKHK